MIPHALSGWFKTGADRLIIVYFLGASATGVYVVAYQMGLVLGVLVTALNKVWGPYLMRTLSSKPTNRKKCLLVKYTYLYFFLVLLSAIILSYIMGYIAPYFLGEKFHGVTDYLIYINLAFAFQGMYFMVVNYIFYTKKTYLLALKLAQAES